MGVKYKSSCINLTEVSYCGWAKGYPERPLGDTRMPKKELKKRGVALAQLKLPILNPSDAATVEGAFLRWHIPVHNEPEFLYSKA